MERISTRPEESVLLTLPLNSQDASLFLREFSDIINSEWDFSPVNEKILKKRLESGELLLGTFYNGKPAGILETISFDLPEEINAGARKERAAYICGQIKPYIELTNNGLWRIKPNNPNVTVLVDITVGIKYRGKIPVARDLVQNAQRLLTTDYIVTFTPDIESLKKWHIGLGAFDTEVVLRNARLNYKQPNVNFMCYKAPEYVRHLESGEIRKAA